MNTLYHRQRPVFVDTPGGSIVDLRVRWTSDLVTSTPNGLAAGETRITACSFSDPDFSFTFAACHPILSGVYYTKVVSGSIIADISLPYDVTEGTYMVSDPDQPGMTFEYLVTDSGAVRRLVSMSILDQNVTVLVNFADGAVWPPLNSVVEPFNVIFDYVPASTGTVAPYISGGTLTPVSGALFTNTPMQSGGVVNPIAHSFALLGNTLTLTGRPVAATPTTHIQSINGVTADHGGITIKFLQ